MFPPRKKKGPRGSRPAEAVNWADFIRIQEELRAAGKWQQLLCWTLGGYTAFRVSDLASLTWGDILDSELSLFEKKKQHLSRGARTVAFGEEAKALIEECRSHMNPLSLPHFVLFRPTSGPRGVSKSMTTRSISRMIEKIAKDHGLNQQCSPHSLRKCCALRAWQILGGNDQALMYVSIMLGHGKPEVTKRYLGITKRVVAEIYKRLATAFPDHKPGFSHIDALYDSMNAVK